jgi:hypothetical protein
VVLTSVKPGVRLDKRRVAHISSRVTSQRRFFFDLGVPHVSRFSKRGTVSSHGNRPAGEAAGRFNFAGKNQKPR